MIERGTATLRITVAVSLQRTSEGIADGSVETNVSNSTVVKRRVELVDQLQRVLPRCLAHTAEARLAGGRRAEEPPSGRLFDREASVRPVGAPVRHHAGQAREDLFQCGALTREIASAIRPIGFVELRL